MSCAMIYWGINTQKFISIFSAYGATLDITSLFNIKIGDTYTNCLMEL